MGIDKMLGRKILNQCLALFAAVFLLSACNHLVPCDGRLVPNAEQVWVEIMPVQCAGNVWQQEWLAATGEYPARENEEEALRAFFRKRSLEFYEYREEWVLKVVCAACSCPQGCVARLLINAQDLAVFEQYGFKLGSGNAATCDDSPDSLIAFDTTPQSVNFGDPYTLHANSAKLDSTTLKLVLSHSGGCRKHEYELRLNRVENTVAYIFLHHNANGDACEAYLTAQLSADLQNFFLRDDWAKLVLLGPNGEEIQLR